MQLYATGESAPLSLRTEFVEERSVGKLYYLFKGRNAWHSTWITRYSDGCMHTSLAEAKQSAERQRQSGTRFYILELPVLRLAGENIALLVTQINSSVTLAHYHPAGAFKYRDNDDIRTCHIDIGSSLYDAFCTFDAYSDYWDVRPPLRDSLIRFVSPVDKVELEPYGGPRSQMYTSISWGSDRYLSWGDRRDSDRSIHLDRVLSW